jgi:FAD/FMN-containing dehydrogenase
MPEPSAALLDQLRAVLGPRGMLTAPEDLAPYVVDWRRLYHGKTAAVLRPANTEEVAQVVRLCAQAKVPLVPQGGNTGMVGGAVPLEDGTALVLSLARLDRIRALDPVDMTLTIEAGATLRAAQEAAEQADCLLPLSIGSEGTAQVGGILSTNAGGNHTVRYGNAREMTLGLEVVLPDGRIWNGLRRLRKDNTGYALRHLFIGAEGTLGVITAAVLRLRPRPREKEIAFCAVASPDAALSLFNRFRRADPASVQAFEYMNHTGIALVLQHVPQTSLPLARVAAHYALVELATPRADAHLRELMENVLAQAMADHLVQDAVIAESVAQQDAIWKLRESHAEAQRHAGTAVRNDVSVPVSQVPRFLEEAARACEELVAGVRVVAFGHMGDGNIHFNLLNPEGMSPTAFLAHHHTLMDAVNAVVRKLDGSFSAEHGVGQLKRHLMPEWRGGVELDLMRRIKHAIDPLGLMNPGKVLP